MKTLLIFCGSPGRNFFMKQSVLFLLTIIGIAKSPSIKAPVQANVESNVNDQKAEVAEEDSSLPLISNDVNCMETQIVSHRKGLFGFRNFTKQIALFTMAKLGTFSCSFAPHTHTDIFLNNSMPDYFISLSTELLDYMIEFLDFEAGQNMSLVSKRFHNATQRSKSLHFKRVKKWMNNVIFSSWRDNTIQSQLFFDHGNSSLKVLSMSESMFNQLDLNPLLAAMKWTDKLYLPNLKLLQIFQRKDINFSQLSAIKELSLKIRKDEIFYYEFKILEQIQLIFRNLEKLQLDLELCDTRKIPIIKRIFEAIPNLKYLVLRIRNAGVCGTRKDLISMLEMLQDERTVLEFNDNKVDPNNLAVTNVLDIFRSELKERSKLKKKVFFYVNYTPDLREIVYENSKQIQVMEFNINENYSSDMISAALLNLGRFDHLKKLVLSFGPRVKLDDLPNLNLKPLFSVTNLTIKCLSRSNQKLVSNLHVIFPNLTVLHVHLTDFKLINWPDSLLKLGKLEKLDIEHQLVTNKALYELLKVVTEKTFPRLRILNLPRLLDFETSEISDQVLFLAIKQWIADNSDIELRKIPGHIRVRFLFPFKR